MLNSYTPGDIVLVPFPFTDLSSTKIRPALVVASEKEDIIIVCISSRVTNTGILIQNSPQNGLKTPSCILPKKIATLDTKIVLGTIGHLEKITHEKVKTALKKIFGIDK